MATITRPWTLLLAVAAPTAAWLSIFGPAWAWMPPQSTPRPAPPADLHFSALHYLHSGGTGFQAAYFSWAAWAFAISTTVIAVRATRSRSTAIAALVLSTGAIEFVATVVAVKGAADWATIARSLPDVRLGEVLALAGPLALAALGATALATALRQTPGRDWSGLGLRLSRRDSAPEAIAVAAESTRD